MIHLQLLCQHFRVSSDFYFSAENGGDVLKQEFGTSSIKTKATMQSKRRQKSTKATKKCYVAPIKSQKNITINAHAKWNHNKMFNKKNKLAVDNNDNIRYCHKKRIYFKFSHAISG